MRASASGIQTSSSATPGPIRPRSSRIGNATAAELPARRTGNSIDGALGSRTAPMASPTGTERIATTPTAIAPERMPARSPGAPRSTCEPATSMSIAKPRPYRRALAGVVGSSQSRPDRPMMMPAISSPTTAGRSGRRPAARSGPTSPATMMMSSESNISAVARKQGPHRSQWSGGRRLRSSYRSSASGPRV